MDPILIYGYPATSSMGLIAALEWRKQPYRLCRVGEMPPSFGRLNRRFETPVLITDEGRVLTESMAIALWLEARDSGRRISFEPMSPEAERMHQMMAFINTGFTCAFYPLWVASHMEPPNPGLQGALREWGTATVIERHDRLEEMMGDTRFSIADYPTLADGMLVGVARWLEYLDVADISRWPKLAALRETLDRDPSVVYATAQEAGIVSGDSTLCTGHYQLSELVELFGSDGSLRNQADSRSASPR